MTTTELKFVPYVPAGFEGAPVDVVDALKRGKAVLVEENRWVKSSWFENEHPEVDLQDPFCNSWKVCAEGAVLVVTIGLHNRPLISPVEDEDDNPVSCPWAVFSEFVTPDYGDPEEAEPELFELADPVQQDLYAAAVQQLRDTGEDIHAEREGERAWFEYAHQFNDTYFRTRDEVLDWFDKAIEDATADA